MPVVKMQQARPMVKDAIVLDLGDLHQQAEALKRDAEAKAAAIVAAAEEAANRLAQRAHDQASEQGFAEGHRKGLEQGKAEGHEAAFAQQKPQLEQLQAAWASAMHEFTAQREQMERDAKDAILDLALLMAEKLVHRVVEVDRTVVVDQLAAVLGYVLRPLNVTVHIHPEDEQLVKEALPQLLAEFHNVQRLDVVPDASVDHGGCVVSYGQGRIDATVGTQLDRAIESILPGGRRTVPGDAAAAQAKGAHAPPDAPPPDDPGEEDESPA